MKETVLAMNYPMARYSCMQLSFIVIIAIIWEHMMEWKQRKERPNSPEGKGMAEESFCISYHLTEYWVIILVQQVSRVVTDCMCFHLWYICLPDNLYIKYYLFQMLFLCHHSNKHSPYVDPWCRILYNLLTYVSTCLFSYLWVGNTAKLLIYYCLKKKKYLTT